MIYISFLIEMIEKFNVKNFFQNMFKLHGIIPKNDSDKLEALRTKTTLHEICTLYSNLKLLYIKFAFEAGYIKISEYYCSICLENIAYLRKDHTRRIKDILNIKLDVKLLETCGKDILAKLNSYKGFYTKGDKEVEFNLYDKFFISYINFNSTLIKYYYKLK
jgi:hypothetical protein